MPRKPIQVRLAPHHFDLTIVQDVESLYFFCAVLRFAAIAFRDVRMTHYFTLGLSNQHRAIRWMLAFSVSLVIAYAVFRCVSRPPYAEIIDDLPFSASLLQHNVLRHGVDYCHILEFSCSDAALREKLVDKWNMREFTETDETPITFVTSAHPDWWTPDKPAAIHKFGWSDDNNERYVSVWEQPEKQRLYVEFGRW